ncbi:hypothetical protein [Corynebacterium urogenitale]
MKKLSLIPIVIATLSLAACSGATDTDEQTSNMVDAWTAAVNDQASSHSSQASSKPAPAEEQDSAEGTVAEPQPTMPDSAVAPQAPAEAAPMQNTTHNGSQKETLDSIVRNNFTIDEKVTISGAPATLCLRGDGYGVSVLAAGPSTSCEFARSTMTELAQKAGAPSNDLRNSLAGSIDVKSSVTNETYSMECSVDADRLITCTGGNNASVYLY